MAGLETELKPRRPHNHLCRLTVKRHSISYMYSVIR